MKIKLQDLEDIMLKIYKARPPKSKEDYKAYNLLRKYLELNTILENPDTNVQLEDLIEQQEESKLRLIFSRKDVPRELKTEYHEKVVEGLRKINDTISKRKHFHDDVQKDVSICRNEDIDTSQDLTNILADVKNLNGQIPKLQKKLEQLVEINEHNKIKESTDAECIVDYLKSLNEF